MKSLLLVLVALTWLAVFSSPLIACQCEEYDVPVCAAYWRSDVVFVGQLRDITLPDPKSTEGLPMATLHFIVEQPFRGTSSATIDVETTSGTMCDLKFVKGTRYLVYANGPSSQKLYTGFCMRTTELADAGDDLEYIRSVMQQSAPESIGGRIRNDRFAGVKIEVRNADKTFEAVPGQKGDFSLSLAGPGAYTVRMTVPSSVIVMPVQAYEIKYLETTDNRTIAEYTVELSKSQCDYRQFELLPVDLHATAELSGSVLTAAGHPVTTGYIYLINATNSNRSTSNKIEEDGSFKLGEVAVGEYFLALNPDNKAPDADDPPYAAAFYPNAADASSATKIVVSEGAKLENLILRVGPAWKARTVSGKVIWEGGGPVTNAHLSLYDGERYVRLIKVDPGGRFKFTIYGNFDYRMYAEVWGKRQGKSDRITITGKSTNLTLVLKPE